MSDDSLVARARGHVKLETEHGDHVGWGQIPPFNVPPRVLIWGARIFRYAAFLEGAEVSPEPFLLYKEAFTFALVTPVTAERPK